MRSLINRADCLKKYKCFPQADASRDMYLYPQTFNAYILKLETDRDMEHESKLAVAVQELMSGLNADYLIFLGDGINPWLCQKNDYPPVRKALKYLAEQKLTPRFNGGLIVDRKHLLKFLPHLYWLQRCNAALPDIHWTNDRQDFLGHLCQYGNIHFGLLADIKPDFMKALKGTGLILAEDCY